KSAMKDVEDALFYLGVPSITKYGIAVQAMNWDGVRISKKEKIDKDTSRIAARLSRREKPHVGIKTRFIFHMMRMMQKSGWGSSPVEKVYWYKNVWLGKKRPWK
ncbi:MAG: NADPH-dependent oxidoreductase, partial [Oliverpabstia sp.]|nr:NADPH-dependent oxidoreductase [Oliverpabstia sp.]